MLPSDSAHKLGYVMQIHNAALAVNWHLSFGYDHAFFSVRERRLHAELVLLSTAQHPQPGPVDSKPAIDLRRTRRPTHIVTAGDIQAATNSIYVYVQNFGTTAAVNNWNALGNVVLSRRPPPSSRRQAHTCSALTTKSPLPAT